jgi:hypothetical protein
MSSKRTFKIAMPEGLDTHDTSPPPLPSWLKGFLVTSKAPSDVRRAGLEVTNILGEFFFKLAYDDVDVPASMVKPGSTEVPYDTAEAILVPGSPGTVFVALRPDECTVDPVFLAAAIVEEADKVGAEGWTKTAHTQRIIPVEAVAPEMEYLTLAKKIVDTHFPAPGRIGDPVTFAVRYEEHSPAGSPPRDRGVQEHRRPGDGPIVRGGPGTPDAYDTRDRRGRVGDVVRRRGIR